MESTKMIIVSGMSPSDSVRYLATLEEDLKNFSERIESLKQYKERKIIPQEIKEIFKTILLQNPEKNKDTLQTINDLETLENDIDTEVTKRLELITAEIDFFGKLAVSIRKNIMDNVFMEELKIILSDFINKKQYYYIPDTFEVFLTPTQKEERDAYFKAKDTFLETFYERGQVLSNKVAKDLANSGIRMMNFESARDLVGKMMNSESNDSEDNDNTSDDPGMDSLKKA